MNTVCNQFEKIPIKWMDQKAKELFGVETKSGGKLLLSENSNPRRIPTSLTLSLAKNDVYFYSPKCVNIG